MKGIQAVCENINIPRETNIFLQERYLQICANDETKELFHKAKAAYVVNEEGYVALLDTLAQKTNIRRETVDLVLLLDCAADLKERYKEKGLSEDLWADTVQDLRYKLVECEKVFGCVGIACIGWMQRYFTCERFALGRLQYEKAEFPCEEYKGMLKKGDLVYNCHIPSSGPLIFEDVLDSLRRAYAFYKEELKDGVMPVMCASWLLYEPHKEIFPDGSNVAKFRSLFEVIENREDETNGDFWRVFYTQYSKETLANAEPTTGMQRRLKTYLQSGKYMGCGIGLFLFNGEKILRNSYKEDVYYKSR